MNGLQFEMKKRDILGRICHIDTAHGRVVTPTLLPVINPNIDLIPPRTMKEKFGARMVITNSYIIRKTPRLREAALEKGVHHLLDFDGPIMTDSGTFQSYVHGDVDVEPLEIVEFQRDIGVDVGTILDVFSVPERTHEQASLDVKRTVDRARDACSVKGDMALATTVQGSVFPDLRERCAEELSELQGDLFPIGGVVPLLESYRYRDVVDIIVAAKRGLNIGRPVHLFGAGHPMIFAMASALGCDLFDSSSYAKYAQGLRMMFPHGTGKLREMEYLPCPCPVCSRYEPSELLKMERKDTIRKLAEHNLHASFAELRRVRAAISAGTLWELVEERAQAHPSLFDALRRMYHHGAFLERFEKVAKKRLMMASPEGLRRPEVTRHRQRLRERYPPREDRSRVVLPDGEKPYHFAQGSLIRKLKEMADVDIAFSTPFGIVPLELDVMYPFAQSLYPRIECEHAEERLPAGTIIYDGMRSLDGLTEGANASKADRDERDHELDVGRVIATLDMQFGRGSGERFADICSEITFRKSRKTRRIRNVYDSGEHVLSFNAETGRAILTITGARLLHGIIPLPDYRVIVSREAEPFIREGKSAFSRFVIDCCPHIRPGDEVLGVGEEDDLLAWGTALLNRKEMLDFQRGIAVKVKKGFGSPDGE